MSKEKYLALYRAVYSRPRLAAFLGFFSQVVTVLTVIVYCAFTLALLLSDLVFGLKFVAVTAIPFLLVTLVRHLVNAPRPYEAIECEELSHLAAHGERGHGFPSRHAASSMIVGTAIAFVSPFVGVAVIVLGVTLGACRVLLGKHFLRDVLAGGFIGALSGVVGMIIVNI